MTREEFLSYLQTYCDTSHCGRLAAYLNHLARGRAQVFTESIEIAADASHILNSDAETFHLIFVPNMGYTYVHNDKHNILRCAMTALTTYQGRRVFFAKTEDELCKILIMKIGGKNEA